MTAHEVRHNDAAGFEVAKDTLTRLIAIASERADTDPEWASKRDAWIERRNTIRASDRAAVLRVLEQDAAELRALTGR